VAVKKYFFLFYLLILAACSPYSGEPPDPENSSTDAGPDSGSDIVSNVVSGNKNTCDGGPIYTHTAGGDNYGPDAGVAYWADCVPVGTHNQAQAMKACAAWLALYPAGGSCRIDETLTAPGCNTSLTQTIAGDIGWMWDGGKFQMDQDGCHPDGNWN
jgi:hypothetical protein